mmetsp:Transcript_20727/g.31102  ORF Transcript_20727/g.31102 Transcript_20727/m.31102 type:complete len:245 (+) Transcript_20727:1141-1875(+)
MIHNSLDCDGSRASSRWNNTFCSWDHRKNRSLPRRTAQIENQRHSWLRILQMPMATLIFSFSLVGVVHCHCHFFCDRHRYRLGDDVLGHDLRSTYVFWGDFHRIHQPVPVSRNNHLGAYHHCYYCYHRLFLHHQRRHGVDHASKMNHPFPSFLLHPHLSLHLWNQKTLCDDCCCYYYYNNLFLFPFLHRSDCFRYDDHGLHNFHDPFHHDLLYYHRAVLRGHYDDESLSYHHLELEGVHRQFFF